MNSTKTDSPAFKCAQAQLDAYNARNIDDFVNVYHDDVQLIDLETGNVFCSGASNLKTKYQNYFASNPKLHCELVNRIVCSPFVYDEEIVTGVEGREAVHAVATYQIRNGKIYRAWFVKENE